MSLVADPPTDFVRRPEQQLLPQPVMMTTDWVRMIQMGNASFAQFMQPFNKTDEERVIVSIADNKNNRKKKKKKEKGETYVAPAGEFGHLSVEELLKVIEGDEAAEKQTTKKEKRRKSREQQLAKETKESSVNNDETGPRTATTTPEMEITEEKPAAIQNVKRTSTASAGNVAWDDADEEFLSADEGMGSNSRLTTPPAEFVDAKGDIKNISEVLLDGANYRADDEDVAAIAKQLTEEDEFITVGKNKKKIEKRTGSVGEYDRSSPQMNVSGNKRNQDDKGRSMSLHDAKQHQQRRPAAKTFSDLLTDVKNETRGGKHHKRKSTGQEEKEHFLETPVDTEITVNTALPSNNNKQSNPVSPDRVSYADAAKKSAEASGESSPQEVSPASSANRKATYPADTPDPSSETFTSDDSNISHCIAVLPNAAHTSPSPQKFSFFYDEHASQQDGNRLQEASSSTNGVNDPNDFVLKLGGRVVRFAKGHAAEVAKMPKPDARHLALISSLREGWRIFMSDEPPVVFTPRTNV
ncbi:unnamed protein product [Caenorhabditis auriculariae]|uniref:Uncharacterized protein n=1 Tax=Caenorhabditis auriculariae TaxID=2777116 RepID=A0A8S1GWY4_9PELO|nr:unnamed protein product [Caenorhabditis auriculariae]